MKDRVIRLKTFIEKRFKQVNLLFRLVCNLKKLIKIKKFPEKNNEFVRINLLNEKKYKHLELEQDVNEHFKKFALQKGRTLKAYLVPSLAGLLYNKVFQNTHKDNSKQHRDKVLKSILFLKQDLPANYLETEDRAITYN